jgi:DNA-directed RNA polymerase subunit RPC12/RpoP
MNIKENLKIAIESSDWKGVCEIYQSMFGETINAPVVNNSAISKPLLERISKGLSDIQCMVELDYSEQEYDSFVVIDENDENDEVDTEEDQEDFNDPSAVVSSSSSEWEKGVSVDFISSTDFSLPEDQIEGYGQALEAHKKRARSVRESYKAHIIKCSKCGVEFDYNKEYPAGMLDSSRGIKCNKCRMIA